MDEQVTFEPQPVLGPRRAAWTRRLLVVPILALVGAAWIGTSGPHEQQAIAEATAPPESAAAPLTEQPRPAWPATILGLDVRTVDQLDPGTAYDGTDVAVAGWYAAWRPLGCPRRPAVDIPGFVGELRVNVDGETFCDRSGVLMSTPDRSGLAALSVVLTPGVPTQPDLSNAGGAPAPVIMVGRLRELGGQGARSSGGWQMSVDRVAWADGNELAQTTSILPRLLDQLPRQFSPMRDRIADAIIGPTGPILMETLVDPATLAFVDPAAATSVLVASPRSERIWYRVALGPEAGQGATRWIAIDDTAGKALVAGVLTDRPFAAVAAERQSPR